MRRQRQIVGAIGARADRRVAARVERLEGGRGLVDPDHFADLDAIADVDADALAKLEEAREAGDAIVRHRDLDNGAAHARRRQIPDSPCDPPLEALERRQRGVGASVDHADDARSLDRLLQRRFGLRGLGRDAVESARHVDQSGHLAHRIDVRALHRALNDSIARELEDRRRRLVRHDPGIFGPYQRGARVNRKQPYRSDLPSVLGDHSVGGDRQWPRRPVDEDRSAARIQDRVAVQRAQRSRFVDAGAAVTGVSRSARRLDAEPAVALDGEIERVVGLHQPSGASGHDSPSRSRRNRASRRRSWPFPFRTTRRSPGSRPYSCWRRCQRWFPVVVAALPGPRRRHKVRFA